jgi:hypothetical protein
LTPEGLKSRGKKLEENPATALERRRLPGFRASGRLIVTGATDAAAAREYVTRNAIGAPGITMGLACRLMSL